MISLFLIQLKNKKLILINNISLIITIKISQLIKI